MKLTQDSIDAELKRIKDSIPKNLMKNVVVETPFTPVMADMVDKALASPDFPEEKKKQLQELKDAGYFSKKKAATNPKIAKMIDQYVSREIRRSVKEGRLPNKKQLAEIIKQNEKK